MKKKINTYLLLTVFLTLMAALLMAVAIFHHIYRRQVVADMRTCAYMLKNMRWEEMISQESPKNDVQELKLPRQSTAQNGNSEEGEPDTQKIAEGIQDGTKISGNKEGRKPKTDLKTENGDMETGNDGQNHISDGDEIRVTVIRGDGTVLYDNEAGDGTLENHSARPEVLTAKKEGEGYAVRHSDTLGRDMYYFALRLDDGMILRISKEADSIWRVFINMMEGIAGIAALMFLVCFFLAHYITGGIVRPIEYLAGHLEEAEKIDTYEELVPFISTIRKQHEDILESAKMRQEFTANVTHELKTPLTSISGYAELIETGLAGEDDVRRFAGGIHRNADRLLTLINDIIRLSELDSDRMEILFTEVDLYEIAADCVEMIRVSAENHGVTIEMHGYHCTVQADRGMIEELIYNLCDNAIRYNKEGGRVDVAVGLRGNRICLSVKDTGIGISEKDQERIFERFYRVDKSHSRKTGGTGLGLAIVKHIVARHHAELKLASEAGKGTEVSVLFRSE